MFKSIVILFGLISLSLCALDRELYNEIKANASFEVLDYEDHLEIFGEQTYIDMNKWGGENHLLSEEMKLALEEQNQKSFLGEEPKLLQGPVIHAEFDWRKVRPECFTPIKNQLYCGSCYSFSVTAALESRICIATDGKLKPELSQQDIVSCDANNMKCKGDRLDNTWRFLETVGTCSLACKPYTSGYGVVDTCTNKCSSSAVPYTKYKAKAGTWRIMNDVDQIKMEIMTNGPMSAGIATFEDFSAYKGGIFIHTTGKATDYHAVVILGWGYDETYKQEYWILRNSWGEKWGEKGYFKILFGMYEVNTMVNASLPDV